MAALVLAGACASVPVERQHLPDGSWQLVCRLPMEGCVREVERVCRNKRYVISHAESETRLRDAPPFATEYHTSRVDFVCNDGSSPDDPVCQVGETRACVGSGACAGGQTCRTDRAGFGPCDCGPAKATVVGAADAGGSPAIEGGAQGGSAVDR